jgi:hypothetical protein
MKRHRALCGLMGSAALLLPLMAVPESRIQTAAGAVPSASAHVNFKIVIPQTLYLHVDAGNGGTAGAGTGAGAVGIMSNGRNVTLNATARTPGANIPARGNVVLSAAGGKAIAQDARCAPVSLPRGAAPAPSGAAASDPGDPTRAGEYLTVCTASMP